MIERRDIELTDDPLTNIYLMIPMLDDRAREAISYLMYGYYLGEELSLDKKKRNDNTKLSEI